MFFPGLTWICSRWNGEGEGFVISLVEDLARIDAPSKSRACLGHCCHLNLHNKQSANKVGMMSHLHATNSGDIYCERMRLVYTRSNKRTVENMGISLSHEPVRVGGSLSSRAREHYAFPIVLWSYYYHYNYTYNKCPPH